MRNHLECLWFVMNCFLLFSLFCGDWFCVDVRNGIFFIPYKFLIYFEFNVRFAKVLLFDCYNLTLTWKIPVNKPNIPSRKSLATWNWIFCCLFIFKIKEVAIYDACIYHPIWIQYSEFQCLKTKLHTMSNKYAS